MPTTTAVGVSPEEYLEFESNSPLRHEYRDGEIVEVTGASLEHILIVGNLISIFKESFHRGGAQAFSNDMRVKIPTRNKYVYPDIVVVRGKPDLERTPVTTLLNPTIVIEVLSESTEDYDRGDKYDDYCSLPTVTDYLLVSQQQERVERFIRKTDDEWLFRKYDGEDAVVELEAVNSHLRLRDIYHRVFFDEETAD